MGLLHHENSPFGRYAPTPAFVAYANLIRQLDAATFERREGTDPRTRIYLFRKGGQEYRVAWTTDAASALSLKTQQPLRIIEIDGQEQLVAPANGEVSLRLTETPIYVQGSVSSITEDRPEAVLVDSEESFSHRQGSRGWQYGYFVPTPAGNSTADFIRLKWVKDDFSYYWGDLSLPELKIGRGVAHPSRRDGHAVSAVRRWQSQTDGKIRLSGHFERSADNGDGVEARVLVDGRPVHAAQVGGSNRAKRVNFTIDAQVQRGSQIDFVVSPGPEENSTTEFDATAFRAIITRPLQPDFRGATR
jgi:hypothetical protein